MPASFIALRTASATSHTWTSVPSSSGRSSCVLAIATEKRFCPLASAVVSFLVKTVACGEMIPSQPPDMTNATRFSTSSRLSRVQRAMVSRKQR